MNLNSKLQHIIDEAVFSQNIPGAILYLAAPQGTWELAAGFANKETQKMMNPRDRFRIASISKVFVATAVLQLVDEEKITLDDTLRDWLPAQISDRLPNHNIITIRQLLNHTSGLADYLDTEEFTEATTSRDPQQVWTPQEAISYIYNLDPLLPPGKKHSYSNTNYILLEIIVEQVTGHKLHQELRSRLLNPLGLKDTFTEAREHLPGGFVEGYEDIDGDGNPEPCNHLNVGLGLGDGGLISNGRDVATFAQTLFASDRLLTPETFQEMLTWVDDGQDGGYGLGVSRWDSDWGEAWGHTGSMDGFLSSLWYIPAAEIIAVALTNDSDRAAPDEIVEGALGLIF